MKIDVRSVGVAILLAGLVAVIWFVLVFEWQPDRGKTRYDVMFELFKFALVTMTVGGATILYNWIRKEQEATEARHRKERETALERRREAEAVRADRRRYEAQRLESYFSELTRTYNFIKAVRRQLRHHAHDRGDGTFTMIGGAYGGRMLDLNQSQLALEFAQRLASIKPAGLENIPDAALVGLSEAEEYLREVIREFESKKIVNPSETLSFSYGDPLGRFLVGKRDPGAPADAHLRFFAKLDVFFQAIVNRMDELGQPVARAVSEQPELD